VNRLFLHPNIRLPAIFAFALALHLCGTWTLPLIDRDEPRFSEASREMLQRGDWILPTFNNAPRYDKPPLTYWCQMVFYKMFGETDTAARLHSAFFTALTALVIFGFCRRLHGERAAWCAALAFTLCLQVMVQAKAAVADMPMVFFVTVAAWAGWELLAQPSKKWWWIFYGALALGFLAKGPVAWLPIGGILIYAKCKRIHCINGAMKFHLGLPLVLLVVGLWGVPALVKTHGEFFSVGIGKHVVQRSFSPLEGHGGGGAPAYFATLPLYFVTVFASFFPWSLLARKTWLRLKAQRTDADLYLLCGIALTFAVFSLVKTKLPHYTLPAFPLLACLVAPRLAEMKPSLFTKFTVGMTALNLALAFIVFPLAANHYLLPVRQICAEANLPPQTEFASVDYDEPSQIWYFRRQLETWHALLQPGEVAGYMAQPGPRLCVLPTESVSTIPLAGEWETKTFRGKNIANGKTLSLTMLVKR
jgi:4-amino-4-deoxy-L-arabinose transferase-like glycosyltransferase